MRFCTNALVYFRACAVCQPLFYLLYLIFFICVSVDYTEIESKESCWTGDVINTKINNMIGFVGLEREWN